MSGCIYICPTPIGNLEDITLRALRVLKECDCIFCEDTRHTAILLRHYEIRKPLISYHKFNAQFRAAELIQRAQKGEQVVLVSDAGMPGVSDPGFEAVRAAREAGVSVTVLPGASASLCGLLLSGLPCDRFVFEGFLPTTGKARRMQIEALRSEKRTVILYESPHRLERTLCELFSALGERTVAVAREISKLYEECINFPLQEYQAFLQEHPPKGEYVLVLSGAQKEAPVGSLQEQLTELLETGMPQKEAIKEVAKRNGVSKNEVYMLTVEQPGE